MSDHRFLVRVYYEDTDMGGIVYHANYLKFVERARSDWVRSLGLDQMRMRDSGIVFAVRRLEADYIAPARFDDELEVATVPVQLTPARLVLDQEVRRETLPVFRARVTVVAVTTAGRPARLPAELRQALG